MNILEELQQLFTDLKKISHKTYADIAKEMGCSERTVRRKLHDVSEIKVMDALKIISILDTTGGYNNEEEHKRLN